MPTSQTSHLPFHHVHSLAPLFPKTPILLDKQCGRGCSCRSFIPKYIDEMIKEPVLEDPEAHKQARNQTTANGGDTTSNGN
jgi:hypothetical protein